MVSEIETFKHPDGQTDGHGLIDSAVDPDQEYIYFWGSANICLLPVTYILPNTLYTFFAQF